MRKYNKNKLFYILLLAMLCAPQVGCPEQQEWYIDDDGCVAGNYFINNKDDLDFIRTVICFRGGLYVDGNVSSLLKEDTFSHIVEINSFMTSMANPPDNIPDGTGIIHFSNLKKGNIISIAKGGISEFSAPQLDTIGHIFLHSPGLKEARFPELTSITNSINITGNPDLDILDLPKLKNIGLESDYGIAINMKGANTILDFNLPELENVHGDIILHGIFRLDESCSLSLPKLENFTDGLSIENSWLHSVNIPLLKNISSLSLIGTKFDGDLADFAVEEVGGLLLNRWRNIDNTATLPYLKKAGSITMRYSYETTTLFMPQLEQLGLLYLVDTKELREVDFPAIQCLGAINFFTDFISGPYCMVPEDFDAIIAQSQAGGCDTTLEMLDPRNSPYWDYADFCEE